MPTPPRLYPQTPLETLPGFRLTGSHSFEVDSRIPEEEIRERLPAHVSIVRLIHNYDDPTRVTIEVRFPDPDYGMSFDEHSIRSRSLVRGMGGRAIGLAASVQADLTREYFDRTYGLDTTSLDRPTYGTDLWSLVDEQGVPVPRSIDVPVSVTLPGSIKSIEVNATFSAEKPVKNALLKNALQFLPKSRWQRLREE